MPLYQFHPERAAHDFRGALKGGDRHVAVLRVEQAADLAAAGLHALGQALAREILRLHGFGNLARERLLDGERLELLELAVTLPKPVLGDEESKSCTFQLRIHCIFTIYRYVR
jgi:hypothetical protein